MGPLNNARHELFSVLVAKGAGTVPHCYREAGFNPKDERNAISASSRLLMSVDVAARVAELKAEFVESARIGFSVTTTDVARKLWEMADYNVADIFNIVTTGKGNAAKQRLLVKDTKQWPEAMLRTCQGVKVNADGSIVVLLPDRRLPAIKVGEHLGMFQGESANQIPPGRPPGITNNGTMVFVDAPRSESIAEWSARIERERGVKQIEHKGNGVKSP